MSKCSKCGFELAENSKFCPNCGTQVNVSEEMGQNKMTPFGIAGFVVSLVAIFFSNFGYMQFFILAVPALCLSILGMVDKKHLKHGLAVAGLVLSIIAIILSFYPPAKMLR